MLLSGSNISNKSFMMTSLNVHHYAFRMPWESSTDRSYRTQRRIRGVRADSVAHPELFAALSMTYPGILFHSMGKYEDALCGRGEISL